MTMITPSYLGETIEYSSLHACRSTLEDPTQDVSRRQFLQWSLALGAAVAMPRGIFAAPMPALAPVFDDLALISDIHVSGGFFSGAMGKHLSLAAQQVLTLPNMPQKILVAGDCAHLSGNKEDYREYVRGIKPLLDAGLPIHMTLGNHDDRDHFWDALPAKDSGANIKLQRQAMVVPSPHANWFLLDSLDKTNADGGELGNDQLAWLAAELDARADKPALLMLHHDPVRNGKKGSLADSEQLLDIVRNRRQVKALFFGHTHVWDVAQDKSGIHLINLPATGYTLWGKSFLGWTSCRVYGDSAFLETHTLDPGAAQDGKKTALKWRPA